MPRVSVVMPAYNAGEYIAEALRSIFDQTYKDFEIVIVDDGSTDNTKGVVDSFLDNHSHAIRYFYQENGGQSSARNRGIRESRGEYVSFLDADDLWVPEFLDTMVKKMDEGYDWVVCDNFRDGIDVRTGTVTRSIQKRDLYDGWDANSLLREFLKEDGVGSPGKMMLRKDVVTERNIFFDSNTDNREDWDLCIQLVRRGCVPGWVHEPLFVYRIRSDNTNITRKRKSKTLYSTFFLLEKNTDAFLESDMASTLGEHYFRLARRFWTEARDFQKCFLCMVRNVRHKGWGDLAGLIRRKSSFGDKRECIRM